MVKKTGFFLNGALRDDERALVFRDGSLKDIAGPGRFSAFDLGGHVTVEVHKVARQEFTPPERVLAFRKSAPDLVAEHFAIVQTAPFEVAIVSFDGEARHLVGPNTTRAFWKTVTDVDVEIIDTASRMRLFNSEIDRLDVGRSTLVVHTIVESHEAALLVVDGVVLETLAAGRHAFWQVGRSVRVLKADLRPQALEVTAQEILTKDRVGIRVTLTAFTKIVDAAKALLGSQDAQSAIYRYVQFAIREAVASRTLDEILGARDRIDAEVRAYVSGRAAELGIEVGEIGVKDIILPGDVRELINKVVEAERVARANLIRRQEETAATRSLLNTARLMDDNPLLLRLKELETLERLVEKVGRIDLHAGNGAGGLDALLSNLYSLSRKEGGT
jgi:regulator of protease activity HflC (stomatin/prohibitin superfamily)